ncbi:tRNA pseudouridine(55) synthase TruB [uncultured Jatrophihabitans sp.]|uniref:tRNA pseudouridine(55) synthase TruB n=1 Tax=uncultured Jatrophihabitans sp. TaxID=1610747 RepID=UPI0035C9DCCD
MSSAAGGLVIVDKPADWTSHDVVARLRRLAGTRRVGHAGTLDPMATGVLVVGVGPATKLLHHLVLADKAYTATIRLGQATDTDDAQGTVTAASGAGAITPDDVRAAMRPLTGAIEQVPSTVSAIKVDGQRAYARARAGETVQLAARPITVGRFVARDFRRVTDELLDVDVEVECSSGTYVRALARDLGAALGTGGHLTALRRTRVGPFSLDAALTLEELASSDDPIGLPLPAAIRCAMPVREVSADEARELSFGRALEARGVEGVHGALGPDGTALALLRESDGAARPLLVFVAAG